MARREQNPPAGALDARALYNPGFVGALIGTSARGHHQDFNSPLPPALAFLVAPMVLHRPTRESLPRLNGRLANWADANPLIQAELQKRAPQLTEVTRLSLRFGLAANLVTMEGAGFGPGSALIRLDQRTEDVQTCFKS